MRIADEGCIFSESYYRERAKVLKNLQFGYKTLADGTSAQDDISRYNRIKDVLQKHIDLAKKNMDVQIVTKGLKNQNKPFFM